jgi:CubicO group peptidase (beta-lactamase class C family)
MCKPFALLTRIGWALASLPLFVLPAGARQTYYPPPESAGGWRTTADHAFIRELGLDPARLAELGRYSVSVPSFEGRTGALVIKNGWIVGEWYDAPEGLHYLYRLASNGKSVAMLLFGRMVQESGAGALPAPLGLDSLLYDRAWLPGGFPLSDARKGRITFDHVFRHTSGILPEAKGDVRGGTNWDFLSYTVGHDPDYPNSAPLYFDPGTPQCPWGNLGLTTGYSSVAFNHLTFVIRRITGVSAGWYLRRRLLEPIGIRTVRIESVQGYEWPASAGLHMTARDYARVAYLMLRHGRWNEAQLLPHGWLDRFTSSPDYPNLRSNVDAFFGAQYPADMYRMVGSGLNWAFVVPSLDLIAIRVGRTTHSQFKAVQKTFLEKLFAAVLGGVPNRPTGPGAGSAACDSRPDAISPTSGPAASRSDTRVVARVPAGTEAGPVVTVNGRASNGLPSAVIQRPDVP